MTLSDHLDMLGVTLMATWAKTKKTNGDAVQLSLQNTIRPWKAGKFLPVTQRGWSLNSYALPKIWFRTKSVDLRMCDIQSITSSYKQGAPKLHMRGQTVRETKQKVSSARADI